MLACKAVAVVCFRSGRSSGALVASSSAMRILALTVVLVVGGCAHDEKLSDQPAQAATQIQNWVPVGTSLADAQHIIEQRHFT